MEKIKKAFNLKVLSLLLMLALILTNISYGMDKSSLRMPLIFSVIESHNNRGKSAALIEALRYKDPWQVARESGNQTTPLFVSTEHATTYLIVADGIEEGVLIQEDTVVINFDKHEDMVNDMVDYPRSNNWLRILLNRKMIAGKLWFNRENNKIEDFKNVESLKGKTIVISIDIDYFEDIPKNERQNAINQIVNFMKNYGLDIKVVTIALSPDYCFDIRPEDVANELCNNIDATLVSYQVYVTRFSYLLKYGLCANLSEIGTWELSSKIDNALPGSRATLNEVRSNL